MDWQFHIRAAKRRDVPDLFMVQYERPRDRWADLAPVAGRKYGVVLSTMPLVNSVTTAVMVEIRQTERWGRGDEDESIFCQFANYICKVFVYNRVFEDQERTRLMVALKDELPDLPFNLENSVVDADNEDMGGVWSGVLQKRESLKW